MAVATGQRRLTVTLSADVNDFVRGLNTAQKALQSASRSMIAIGQNLAFGIGAPLAAISARLIKVGGDFEKAGNNIVTQTTLSREQVNKLTQDVAKLSDSLKVTASQGQLMAGGLAVAGAGLGDTTKVLQTMEKAAQLSSLGLGDMDTVARALTATMTAFAPQGVNAAEAANAFLLAVQEGGFPAQQLAGVISRLGSSAAMSGVSLHELIAALSVYTRTTGDADEATTGLTRILSDIAAPSEKARKLWMSIFPTEGVLKARKLISEDMIGFLVTLARKMNELPIEQLQEVAVTFFDNERAARAFMNVFGAQGDAVVETLKRIATNTTALPKALNQVKDSWDRIFGIMTKEIDDLSTVMGEHLLPVVKMIATDIGAWLFAVRPLLAANARLAVTIAATTAGLIAMLIIVGQVGLGISALAGFFMTAVNALLALGGALATAAAGLTTWIGLAGAATGLALTPGILAAVGAVVAFTGAFTLMSTETSQLAKMSANNWVKAYAIAVESIKLLFLGLTMAINNQFIDLFKNLKVPFRQLQEGLVELGLETPGRVTLFEKFFDSLSAGFEKGNDDLRARMQAGMGDIRQLAEQIIFEVRPRDQKFPTLQLPTISVPGEEIAKLQQMSVGAKELEKNLKALEGLKIQVFDLKTGELRAATIDELKQIQKEAGALEPIDPGVFSFEDMYDRFNSFKIRLKQGFAEVPGFAADFQNLLKNLGITLGDIKLPGEKEGAGAKEFANGLAQINEMLFKQADAILAAENGWTDFQVATNQGSVEIAKIGEKIGLSIEQIMAFQEAWKSLRNTLDAKLRANEDLKGIRETLRDAREELSDLKTGWTETEKALHKALDAFEAVDLTGLTDAQLKELRRLKLATFDTYAEIERETHKLSIDLVDTFSSAFDSILRGVLQGTQTWKDVLGSFADIGTGLILDMFKQWIEEKIKVDKLVIPNFGKTIPDAVQKTIDALKQGSSVLAEISDQDLADIIAGAEPAVGAKPIGVPEGSVFKGPGVEEIEGLKNDVDGFFETMSNYISDGWAWLTGQIPEVDPIALDVPVMANPIEPITVGMPTGRPEDEFDRTASSHFTDAAREMSTVTSELADLFAPVTEGFTNFLDLFSGFGSTLSDAGTAIGDFFADLFDPEMLKDIGDKVGGWFKQLFSGDLLNSIYDFARSAIGAISSLIQAISMLAGGGQQKGSKAMRILGIISSVSGGLSSALGGVSGALSSVGTAIADMIPPQTVVSSQFVGQYAKGGIAKRPTMGVFGEKGPEALVPLSKMGDYMASPETTVIVNSPHPATVRDTSSRDERSIEIVIDDVIAKSFRTGGKAAQAMERNFGVRRQGGAR